MRKTLAGLVLVAVLTACGAPSGNGGDVTPQSDNTPDYGGPGMTYTGKQGIEIMDGFVMPYDGSGLQPGFGY